MKQQTAIEWLEIQFEKYTSGGVNVPNSKIFKLTEKAKQMEKEQIVVSFYEGMKTNTFDPNVGRGILYYTETYGGKKVKL